MIRERRGTQCFKRGLPGYNRITKAIFTYEHGTISGRSGLDIVQEESSGDILSHSGKYSF